LHKNIFLGGDRGCGKIDRKAAKARWDKKRREEESS